MWQNAWILFRKDLMLYFRDKTALLLSLALPVVLATIFGTAMQGMSGDGGGMNPVRLLVDDRDGSAISKALVAELEGMASLRVKRAEEDPRGVVARGRAPAALVIPEGYAASLGTGEALKLLLLRDPAQGIEQQVVLGSLAPAVLAAGAAPGVPPLAAMGFDMTNLPKQLGIETENVAGGQDDEPESAGASHAIAGVAVMMLLFSVVGAGGTLLEEQHQGTLQRLQLTPSAGDAILLGKLLVVGFSALLQLVIMFGYGAIVFGVPVLENPVALAATSFALAFAASGLGLTFAVYCRTQKQLEGISTLVILVMSAMGGSWFPLVMTPEWFQTLGHFTLNAWAMDAYQGVLWYKQGLGGIWQELLVLTGIGGVLLFAAFRGYRRRYRSET